MSAPMEYEHYETMHVTTSVDRPGEEGRTSLFLPRAQETLVTPLPEPPEAVSVVRPIVSMPCPEGKLTGPTFDSK